MVNLLHQDWPGRRGLWSIGVPPSGPMDSLSFRLANALVGNPPDAAGLEVTIGGPTLKFHAATTAALAGAAFEATLDGKAVPFWESFAVPAGSTLTIGLVGGASFCSLLLPLLPHSRTTLSC